MSFSLEDHPHRRYNALSGKWILCSPHRAKRPWQGQTEAVDTRQDPSFDPKCFLCPGNTRVTGAVNDPYDSTFVFGNDFPALLSDTPSGNVSMGNGGLLRAESARGECRVMCFSPDHSLSLAQMPEPQVLAVVDRWVSEYRSLSEQWRYVQVFENKGAVMGCSNPHPHAQIWATDGIPMEIGDEIASFKAHSAANGGRCLLCDYLQTELAEGGGARIVTENAHWVALVPFWAYWPFELLVLPRTHRATVLDLADEERVTLAAILREVTCRYDNLFCTAFPYSMGLHQLRADGQDAAVGHHLHIHFYPPLLRSATVKCAFALELILSNAVYRKFQVGYEMMCELVRDITAEQAADRLRQQPTVHFKAATK